MIITPTPLNRKPPAGSVPDYNHPLMRGLIGWYPMLEGGGNKLYDYSKRNGTATLNNMDPGTDWVAGNPRFAGLALDFDGSNDRVNGPAFGQSLDLAGRSAVSMSAWVNIRTLQATSPNIRMIASYEPTSGVEPYLLRLGDGGTTNKFQAVISTGGSSAKVFSTTLVSTNTWYHVALTWDAANIRIFVNGTEENSVAKTGTLPTIVNGGFVLGSQWGGGRYMDGIIDDVRVYDRTLSAQEIKQLYTNPWQMFEKKALYVDAVASTPPPTGVNSNFFAFFG